jgi:16S rRNA (adenine1518-N6/adenine1519-N6)-dimethyltransferase
VAGYRAKKRLGQNFLHSKEIITRIVSLVDPRPGELVIEIGSGRGALTVPLAESGARVLAVEYDNDLVGYLSKLTRPFENVSVIHADFLNFEPPGEQFTLVGNIPYNITSPVLDWCFRFHEKIDSVYLMVQRELARRITAQPATKSWSPLSIMTQLFFESLYEFDVPPDSFRPPPKVTSAVVRLVRHPSAPSADLARLGTVVRASFGHRRKLLVNNLSPELAASPEQLRSILKRMSLPEKVRAEELTLDQFLSLTEQLRRDNIV